MIDSKIKPQPGEGGGISNIKQRGGGLQEEEPGATIPDRDPGFECMKEKDQVQAEGTTTLFTFAEACAQPSAKHLIFHGCNGPVKAVDVDGTFYIQNAEAEAKAARSKALELVSEAAEARPVPPPLPKPAAALGFVAQRKSYAAAAAKATVGPKPSAAGLGLRAVAPSNFSAGPKCSSPASKPAVANAPLEVRA